MLKEAASSFPGGNEVEEAVQYFVQDFDHGQEPIDGLLSRRTIIRLDIGLIYSLLTAKYIDLSTVRISRT